MSKKLIIETAKESDKEDIILLLKELDLFSKEKIGGHVRERFWVARLSGKIIGTARLSDHGKFYFLSSVGVKPEHRQLGIAKSLIGRILIDIDKDIYLYTIIPKFFEKLGFKTTKPNKTLPSKESFGCEDCSPALCFCMKFNCKSRHG